MPQESWAAQHSVVSAFVGAPPERMLFCGIAIGVEDRAAPVNALHSDRADPAEWLTVL